MVMPKVIQVVISAVLAAILVHLVQMTPAVASVPLEMVWDTVSQGAIHTWSSGETLTSSDLNANFAHIHNYMVGGHGGRLVNADVSASAAIASTKIQYGGGIAKSHVGVYVACGCGAAPCFCTLNNPYNVTSVQKTATGTYRVTWNFTAAKTPNVQVTTVTSGNICTTATPTTTTVDITCVDLDTPAATDSAFTFTLWETP